MRCYHLIVGIGGHTEIRYRHNQLCLEFAWSRKPFLKHLENLVKSVSIYTFFIIHIFHVTFVLFQFLIVYRFSLYFLINLVQESVSPLNLIIKELTECFIFKNHLGALDFINVLI